MVDIATGYFVLGVGLTSGILGGLIGAALLMLKSNIFSKPGLVKQAELSKDAKRRGGKSADEALEEFGDFSRTELEENPFSRLSYKMHFAARSHLQPNEGPTYSGQEAKLFLYTTGDKGNPTIRSEYGKHLSRVYSREFDDIVLGLLSEGYSPQKIIKEMEKAVYNPELSESHQIAFAKGISFRLHNLGYDLKDSKLKDGIKRLYDSLPEEWQGSHIVEKPSWRKKG